MKRLATYGMVLATVLCSVGLLASPAAAVRDSQTVGLAAAAGPQLEIDVNRRQLRGDQKLVVTATAAVDCDWIVSWNGERRHTTGTSTRQVFVAPTVAKPVKRVLDVACFRRGETSVAPVGAPPAARPRSAAQRVTVTVPQNTHETIGITVIPPGGSVKPPTDGGDGDGPGDGDGDGLPNTGGPNLWLALAALASLLGGSIAVRRSRRMS